MLILYDFCWSQKEQCTLVENYENNMYVCIKGSIYKYQSGFRPKHSMETAVLNASNRWFFNIDQGMYNLVVFLDLRKALDTVNHEILLKLEYYEVHGTELKWFTSYLRDRRQYTVVGATPGQYFTWSAAGFMFWTTLVF